jgi:hypothetical protein
MPPMNTDPVKVPGATLYDELRGSGPASLGCLLKTVL